MTHAIPPLKVRAMAIQSKVNLLETLHKTCQLSELGLNEPILNESRYLSRALADVLFNYEDDAVAAERNLSTAELAVHSGINDAVDILITFVKTSLSKLEEGYPEFKIAVSSYGDSLLETLCAIQELDELVVYSRGNRIERYEIYKSLSEAPKKTLLDTVSNFALKLAQIEAVAQRSSIAFGTSINDDALIQYLTCALAGNDPSKQFSVYLQPKYSREGTRDVCCGAEALLRLKADGNHIPPTDFIGAAERARLIAPIGRMVLQTVVKVLASYPTIPCISINVSAIELLSPGFANEVLETIAAEDVHPGRIELEITERVVLTDGLGFSQIQKLSKAGLKISIDDFGTGETRFDYLAKFPVDVLKIDMSLVRQFVAAPTQFKSLLLAIRAIGEACSMEVIAEGIETTEQATLISGLGITLFQGYYFGKPACIEDFVADHLSKIPGN